MGRNSTIPLTNSTFQQSSPSCGSWLLPISIGPGTLTGFDAESFCLPPCCVPCPPQGRHPPTRPPNKFRPPFELRVYMADTFFPQYVRFFKVLDIVNVISLFFVVVYCILWMTVLYRSPKFRVRSRYVMGTAVALVFWHIPGLITLIATPETVLCENPISRATEKTNQFCAVQGAYPLPQAFLRCRLSVCVFDSCRGNSFCFMDCADGSRYCGAD